MENESRDLGVRRVPSAATRSRGGLGRCLLPQDPVHLGAARRAGALGGPPARWRARLPDPQTAAFHGISHSNPRTKPRSSSSTVRPARYRGRSYPWARLQTRMVGTEPRWGTGSVALEATPQLDGQATGGSRRPRGSEPLAGVATGCHTGREPDAGGLQPASTKGVVVTTGTEEPVITILAEEWEAIDALARDLADAEWDLPSECPGWTVRDMLSHLIGIERMLAGRHPPPAHPSCLPRRERGRGPQRSVGGGRRRSVRGATSCDEFREVTARRLVDLRAWPASRFDEIGPSPVGEVPYREFMHVRVMDSWVHEQDIRVATGRSGSRFGSRPRSSSLDRLCVGHALRRGQAGRSAGGGVGALRPTRVVAPAHRRGGA